MAPGRGCPKIDRGLKAQRYSLRFLPHPAHAETSAEEIKLWNTSLESNLPRDVRQTESPHRSISPPSTNSEIVPWNSSTAFSPKPRDISRKSTPAVSRSPRKKLSSKAACRDTTVCSKGAPETYFSNESAVENRTASAPEAADISIECAS